MTDADRITIEPAGRRWRARFNGGVLADSKDAMVLREAGHPARVYFPAKDVEQGYLSPAALRTTCPHKGEARYWTVEYDGQFAENAVWSYPEPSSGVSQIAGRLAFDESKGFEVYEVGEEQTGHSLTDAERG